MIARSKLHRLMRVLKVLGLYRGLSYVTRAKVLKDYYAEVALRAVLHGETSPPVVLNRELVLWRNRVFHVPPVLRGDFFLHILEELIIRKAYRFDSAHDVIIDVGGFLGESAWWFLTEGLAKKVIVFEPVYYELCVKNIGDVAEVHPHAIHWIEGKARMKIMGSASMISNEGEVEVFTKPLASVLSRVSGHVAVKMDCEGCEESLLHTPCDLIRRADEYIVEIHPNVNTYDIINYMKRCGFGYKPKTAYWHNVAIYHFFRTSP